MALLIKAGKPSKTVSPANGDKFTLDELQGYVDGFIERIDLQNGKAMYINEDGKALRLPYNATATVILKNRGCLIGDYIAGSAIVLDYSEED